MSLFSIILGFGASLGLLRILRRSPAAEQVRWLFAGLIVLAGGLVGARIGFVLTHFHYFQNNISESIHLELGGLSWPGAVIGSLVFALAGVGILHKPYIKILDQLSALLLPVATAVWLGCWQAGVAYGQILESGTWWGILARDESGVTALRVPVQPAAALSLILFLSMAELFLEKKKTPGLKAGITSLVFSLHSLLFSLMRADPVQEILNLRLDTWASILLILASVVFLLLSSRTKSRSASHGSQLHHGVNI